MRPSYLTQPGNQVRVTTQRDLFAFSHRAGGAWRHPWQTQAFWNARGRQWLAMIEPGFVNAESPVWRTTVREQAEADRDFWINPLTGEPFFSAHVFARERKAAELRAIEVPLYLGPAIPLTWRALGLDGDPSEPIPQFFKNLGVLEAPAPPSLDALDTPQRTTAGPRRWRLLRACDIWIHQPRLALTSSVTLTPGLGLALGTSNVQQTLGVRSASGDRLKLLVGGMPARTGTIDPLAGDYEEATADELLVATVFALSPLNAPLGSEPDGTWQAFTRHRLFWHLSWDQPDFRLRVSDGSGIYIPPLAGGAAQVVINFLTASINDATNQTLNLLNGHSLAGTFWTSTGGGHDSAALETTAQTAELAGLDKAARNTARAQASALTRRSQRLDPPFPFHAERFDLSLLTN